mgnify:CR=1 FL=1
MRQSLFAASALAMLLGLAACAPITDRRGFLPDETQLADVVAGTDTKSTVLARYGNPSTIGVFDEQVWYYYSANTAQLAFYKPRVTERTVLTVRFDDADTVAEVTKYGVKDGRIVSYTPGKTPTRGRELTIVEQLFGNLGRAPIQLPGDDQTPDSAGGPRRR